MKFPNRNIQIKNNITIDIIRLGGDQMFGQCHTWAARTILGISLLASLGPFQPGSAEQPEWADDPVAREIMQKVDDRDDGDNVRSTLEMILIDKRGHKRVRRLRSLRKEKGPDSYSLLFFLSPPDVQDTGFMTYDYDDPERDDDQWLYLPALKKTKRIASSGKSGAFMGSDISYADLTDRPLEYYDYKLLKEDRIGEYAVWVIEAVPNNEDEIKETGYTRVIQFIRQDNYVPIRAKIWLRRGGRKKYMEVKELAQIDGIWMTTLMTMTTKKGKKTEHKTILRTSDIEFDQPLEFDTFTVRGLEAGP